MHFLWLLWFFHLYPVILLTFFNWRVFIIFLFNYWLIENNFFILIVIFLFKSIVIFVLLLNFDIVPFVSLFLFLFRVLRFFVQFFLFYPSLNLEFNNLIIFIALFSLIRSYVGDLNGLHLAFIFLIELADLFFQHFVILLIHVQFIKLSLLEVLPQLF